MVIAEAGETGLDRAGTHGAQLRQTLYIPWTSNAFL